MSEKVFQLIHGRFHVVSKGGMCQEKAFFAFGKGFIECRTHLVDILADGIFDVIFLVFTVRKGINLPFLMKEAIGCFDAVFGE